MSNLFSLFNKHYKKFLAFQLLIDNEKLIKAFAKKQLRKEGNTETKNLKFNDISNIDILKEDFFSINIFSGNLIEDFSKTKKEKDRINYQYEGINNQFKINKESKYITEIILICNYCFLQKNYSKQLRFPEFENRIKQLTKEKEISKGSNLNIYYKAFILTIDPSYNNYKELINLFQKNIAIMHSDHATFISSTLINYITKQINEGKESFFTELFNIYNFILQKEIRDKYNDTMIFNYTKAGCWGGNAKEVKLFLESNQEFINTNALNYCLALVAYSKSNYRKSLKILLDVNYTNIWYKISSRNLIIRNFIMLEEFDVALHNIESFRIFLIRCKNLKKEKLRTTLNDLKYLKHIALFLLNKDSMSVEKIKLTKANLIQKITKEPKIGRKKFLLSLLMDK